MRGGSVGRIVLYNSTDSGSVRFKRVVRLSSVSCRVCSVGEWKRGSLTTNVCSESVDSHMIPMLEDLESG